MVSHEPFTHVLNQIAKLAIIIFQYSVLCVLCSVFSVECNRHRTLCKIKGQIDCNVPYYYLLHQNNRTSALNFHLNKNESICLTRFAISAFHTYY